MPVPAGELSYLDYFEDVGHTVRWIRAPHVRAARLVGKEVSSINGHGYLQVSLLGRKLQVHRVLWEMRNGPIPAGAFIDHADGDKLNNRPDNLRLCSAAQNLHNMRLTRRNTSGVKGLSYSYTRHVWVGAIHCRGKAHKFQSKCRTTVEQWIAETRARLHGEFARNS